MQIIRNPNNSVQVGSTSNQLQASQPDGSFTNSPLAWSGNTVQFIRQTNGNVTGNLVEFGSNGNRMQRLWGNRLNIASDLIFSAGNYKLTGTSGTGQGFAVTQASTDFVKDSFDSSNKGTLINDSGLAGNDQVNPNAIFEGISTTRGILFPRMTDVQMEAIANEQGNNVFNFVDRRPYFNSGARWKGYGDLRGLYAQTVNSADVTNTTTETSIVGMGAGSLTIPANGFVGGDSFHAKIGGEISAQNGDTITINVNSGATTLATTGSISLSATTTLGWELELDFIIKSIGVTGSVGTNGNFAYNRNTGGLEGYIFNNTTTLDTTVSNTLDITVTWGQAKTQDVINSQNFVLYRTYYV